MIIIDTPGFGKKGTSDYQTLISIAKSLNTIGYVHTFVINVDSKDPKIDDKLEATIKVLIEMFSPQFFKNSIVCFTKFENT